MLILGIAKNVYRGTARQNKACPQCGKTKWIPIGLLKYIHVFFIPFTLHSKFATLECEGCKYLFPQNELSKEEISAINRELFSPLRLASKFLASVIILCLLAYYFLFIPVRSKQFFANPQVDDVYIVDLNDLEQDPQSLAARYALLRITSISEQSIEFLISNTASKSMLRIEYELSKDSAHQNAFWKPFGTIKKEDLSKMYNNDTIEKVIRDWQD